jgi:hypothetical protein
MMAVWKEGTRNFNWWWGRAARATTWVAQRPKIGDGGKLSGAAGPLRGNAKSADCQHFQLLWRVPFLAKLDVRSVSIITPIAPPTKLYI